MHNPDDPRTLDSRDTMVSPRSAWIERLNSFDTTDILSSGTIQLFQSDNQLFSDVLNSMDGSLAFARDRMLDMGCGYGGLSSLLGSSLGFKQMYGLDLNENRMSIASKRGLTISRCDLGDERFPFPDNYFDFAISFGVLDHMKSLDNPISEAHRVLKVGGCLALSTTNLSSWVNRMALLLGYQPRNLEISGKGLFGVHRLYKQLYACTDSMGRISSFTLRALEEFLKFNGFSVLRTWGAGLIPSPDRDPGALMRFIDRILSKRPSLAVRFIVLTKKIR